MTDLLTREFYDLQSPSYAVVRARPIQIYTDALEREAFAPYVSKASDILDLGCGEGRLTRWIAETKAASGRPFSVHGADFSPGMVEAAQALNGDRHATYGVGDAMALPFTDDSFDLVVSCTAPNNFPSFDVALDEIRRILRPGGVFAATIINAEEAARFARYAYLAPYYIVSGLKRAAGIGTKYHRVLFTADDLRQLIAVRYDLLELRGLRVLADFLPEYPLNFWKPLFPLTRAYLSATRELDRRLSSASMKNKARFHFVAARAAK